MTSIGASFTILAGTCLSYLRQGEDSEGYFAELRAGTTDPVIHMNTCYNMAMLYTRHLPKEQHDETRAVEWINTAIALADRDPDPHKRAFFGAFMRNARALIELHRADVPRALALVDEAMQRVETGLEDHEQLLHRSVLLYNRAQIRANLGQHEDSLRDYDELIGRDPDYGDYYFERAAEHRALGRPENALADYAEAIRLSLPFHQAHFNRADLLRELGDHEGARRDLDYAVLLDPTHLDSLTNRADLLLDLGLFDRAAEDIAAGLALEPADARLLAARGSLLAEAGDTDAALASFTAALDADPTLTAAWANRAVLHYTAGRPADSAGDLDRAIALDPDPALHANRALALQELGDHGRALADLDIAVAALGDEDPDLFYRRGASRRALGDLDGADADWRTHLAAYGPGEVSPFAAEIDLERTA
ncbi:tetratricopeptide repeat protein [Streptomyces sp. NPDC056160]|uniref:tetratricopeptide repeat protein n=1 Tax=Streptomyces sp. NPDC056160 TaxID=3345731 RepID=UPI0035DE86FA